MFADERKGNTAKKRADENRRRRLLLKEQQAKKTSGVTKLETVGVKAAASLPQVSGPISALEKADLARKERASETKQQNAATTIQSRARSIRARKDFRNYIRKNLASSLQEMVRRITDEKKSGRKAQVSTNEFQLLMSQLWIVTSRFRSGSARSVQLEPQSYPVLALLLSCAVNVGIDSSDGSKGVLTPLVETKQGIYRLCALLRLWLVALLDVNSPDVLLSNCFLFWKAAILGDPNKLQRVMRKVLFSESRVTVARQARATGNSEISSTIPLDLIANFRYFMLFQIAGPNPIPSDAESSREACIPTARRQRCGKIWYQIHSTIASEKEQSVRETLSLRCAIELWTVPLLTWKLSTDTISRIVTSSDGQIPFLTSLTSLIRYHGGALSAGKVSMVLEGSDLPVTVCPATAVQCMLANFVQICKVAPSLNGMSPQVFDYAGSIQLWNLLTCLILAAPEATFTSRESSVAWVNVDGRQQPIVLSRVITEQCRGIFVDSFLRRVWQLVLDPLVLKTQDVLGVKSTEDIKLEDDFKKSSAASAILMAAQEAHKDRSQSFWKSSKWAKNLSGKVTGLLGNAKKPQPSSLPNTSSIAHKLASGKGSKRALSRWGGMTPDFNERVSAKPETFVVSFLNTLGFSTSFLMQSWGLLQQNDQLSKLISSLLGRTNMAVASIKVEIRFDGKDRPNDILCLLFMFLKVLSHTLIVTDDVEIHDLGKPLPLHQLRRVVVVLRKILHKVYCADIELKGGSTDQFGSSFIATSAQTMKDLYDRSSRRPWCAPKLWLVPDLMEKEISACRTHADYVDVLNLPVFRFCPFLVSFKRRLKLFEQIVTKLRVELQGESSANPFHSNPLKGGIPIRITRGRILEDGLATMNKLGPNMRQRLSIQYYNEAGARESGIDAGGLFKEFWTDLCAIAYNPDYALFSVTDGAGNCLYPNPLSASVHGSDSIVLFSFLGRILGKAMFEGISISPQFAHFFLSYMRGDYNFLHMLADLSTVDPQLYNNLMFLKTYDGDAADLCLTFTVASDSFGGKTEVPLVHGGESVEVTNSNKTRYVELVAKHYVVDRVKEQSQAFTTGLWEVINKEWLQIFNEPELQVLISGATDGDIDVKDMRAHTRYAGGFTGIDRTVNRFWKVVESMDRNQQAALLRFVTSCERPPPLGFGSLNPPFTIQRVGILRDGEKLPSASTCFNVLKLPTYSSEKVMKERLVYAIESGAGFELS